MENLKSRLGYLRGLAEGLGINDDTKEGKVIRQIISVLEDIVDSVESLKEDYDELFSYVEALDEDLSDLEDDLMEEGDYEDYEDYDEEGEEDEDAYEVPFTVECPECHQEVAIDEDILEDEESLEVLCPNCGKVVFINDEGWDEGLEDEEGEEEEEEEK